MKNSSRVVKSTLLFIYNLTERFLGEGHKLQFGILAIANFRSRIWYFRYPQPQCETVCTTHEIFPLNA